MIWPDADKPGRGYAADVARLCREAGAKEVRVITPPEGVSEGWDAADALIEDWDAERAMALAEAAQKAPEHTPSRRLRAVTIHDFLDAELPPRENILGPWLPTQGLAMIYSKRGVGKTHMAPQHRQSPASGGKFLGFVAPEPRRVLYVDGEMPAVAMQERLAAIVKASNAEPPAPDYLKIITPDLQEHSIPDLSESDGQEAIEEHLDGVSLVIIDNLSTIFRHGNENEAESRLPAQEWALRLRRRGVSVLFIHHAGKGGQQRGTSRREDVLDTVICLKHPTDYTPTEGARFEVHFDKARGLYGDVLKPFEARMETRDDAALWTITDIEDRLTKQVAELANAGLTQRDIAKELEIGLSTVNRHIKKGRERAHLSEA